MAKKIILETTQGTLSLTLNPSTPITCGHITKMVAEGLYDGCCFYRSDFVIQMGLVNFQTGEKRECPYGRLTTNESGSPNVRGAVAMAHWDCLKKCGTGCTRHTPDAGGSEFFVNLKTNSHLDQTWGGYCVFAHVDQECFPVVDAIEREKKEKGLNTLIKRAYLA